MTSERYIGETEKNLSVLVAGVTGRAGLSIFLELLEQGIQPRGISRSMARLRALGLSEETAFEADALMPETLVPAFEGVDVVISAVGIDPMKFGGRTRFAVGDLQANRNLLAAAKRAGVRRFVYLSVFGNVELDKTAYVRTHREFERELGASGLETGIVRPTGFFSSMLAFREMAIKRGRTPVIGNGKSKSNPVHEADVAEACVRAAVSPVPVGVIEIGGPDVLTRREIAELAFTGTGKKPKTMRAPKLLWSAVRLPTLLVAPHSAEVMQFAAAVSTMDAVAPKIGTRRLVDYFADLPK